MMSLRRSLSVVLAGPPLFLSDRWRALPHLAWILSYNQQIFLLLPSLSVAPQFWKHLNSTVNKTVTKVYTDPPDEFSVVSPGTTGTSKTFGLTTGFVTVRASWTAK